MWRSRLTTTISRVSSRASIRWVSANGANGEASWRKEQLEKLESRFQNKEGLVTPIKADDELQSHWKEMEGRVVRRRPISRDAAAGKVGRRNVRKTDEDVWMDNGLYDEDKKKP